MFIESRVLHNLKREHPDYWSLRMVQGKNNIWKAQQILKNNIYIRKWLSESARVENATTHNILQIKFQNHKRTILRDIIIYQNKRNKKILLVYSFIQFSICNLFLFQTKSCHCIIKYSILWYSKLKIIMFWSVFFPCFLFFAYIVGFNFGLNYFLNIMYWVKFPAFHCCFRHFPLDPFRNTKLVPVKLVQAFTASVHSEF